MNRPPVTSHSVNAPDAACSDPLCSYRAEIEAGHWIESYHVLLPDDDTAVELLAAAIQSELDGPRRVQIIENDPEGMGSLIWAPEFAAALIERLREGGPRE